MQTLHFLAGLIVLFEALNKLERTSPFARGLTLHTRLVDGLKAVAWILLAVGAGGAVMSPVLCSLGIQPGPWDSIQNVKPTLAETSMLVGFAVLVIRTRVKEG